MELPCIINIISISLTHLIPSASSISFFITSHPSPFFPTPLICSLSTPSLLPSAFLYHVLSDSLPHFYHFKLVSSFLILAPPSLVFLFHFISPFFSSITHTTSLFPTSPFPFFDILSLLPPFLLSICTTVFSHLSSLLHLLTTSFMYTPTCPGIQSEDTIYTRV